MLHTLSQWLHAIHFYMIENIVNNCITFLAVWNPSDLCTPYIQTISIYTPTDSQYVMALNIQPLSSYPASVQNKAISSIKY